MSGTECQGRSCCSSLLVEGGTFYRGTDTSYPATISSYCMDEYEITVGRFRKFVTAYGGSWRPSEGAGQHPSVTGSGWQSAWPLPADQAALITNVKCNSTYQTWTDTAGANEQYPMNCINWYEAFAFCIWDGGRLATEAEWEYAAAGGNNEWTYPWGNTPSTDPLPANYSYTDNSPFIPVGKYPAGHGLWGQADLAGSMWEWVFDWDHTYQNPCNNCANTATTSYRVLRGGSWLHDATPLAAAARDGSTPTYRYSADGGRCVRSVQ